MKSSTKCIPSHDSGGGMLLIVLIVLVAVIWEIWDGSVKGSHVAGQPVSPEVNRVRHDGQAVTGTTSILARVNGDDITWQELHRVMTDMQTLSGPRLAHPEHTTITPDYAASHQELEHEALIQLIHRRLILQGADRQQLSVSQLELDKAVTDLRSRFVDLGSFGSWMLDRGLDDRSLINTLRDDMLVKHFMALLVENVSLTEEEVVDYYVSGAADLTMGEEVRLRIIVVDSSEKAQELLAALRKGRNFGLLARQHSLGMRAAQGGDTGWVNSEMLAPSLRKIVDILQPGEASHPVQKNNDEFLIVALVGRSPLRAENFDEARSVIRQRLLATKQKEAVQAWLAEQEINSNIEVFQQAEKLSGTD